MTPERWRQIEELYHSARERVPADRVALLAQADPQLRREVEAMLGAGRFGRGSRPGFGGFVNRFVLKNGCGRRCPGAHLALGVSFRSRSRSGEEVLNSAKERAESPRRQQSGEKQS